jgi:Ca-activated chloride channel family protein
VDVLQLGRGTNIGDGLRLALAAIVEPDVAEFGLAPGTTPARPADTSFDPDTSVIVLLSDGASTTGPPPLQVAADVAQTGIKTYTVGLGTTGGGSGVTPQFGGFGGGRFMELDERTLRGIAEATGGEYFSAQSAGQLQRVYAELRRKEQFVTETTEVTFVVTGVGLILMLGGAAAGMLWSSKLP